LFGGGASKKGKGRSKGQKEESENCAVDRGAARGVIFFRVLGATSPGEKRGVIKKAKQEGSRALF